MSKLDELRRLRTAFHGWPTIAARGFLWKHLKLPEREIQLRSRGGGRLMTPIVPNVGALYGAIEVFALEAYDFDWRLEENPVILDIGSNIGAWVVRLSEQRPQLRGACYEPDPAAAAFLRRNLKLNGLDAGVEVFEEAVSDRNGTAPLFQAQPGEGSSSLRETSPVAQFDRETMVPTVTFEKVINRIGGEVSLVKMDCEGAEYDILESSTQFVWQKVKRVVLEYHPADAGRHEALRRRFGQFGFTEVREDRRPDGLGTLWLARASA